MSTITPSARTTNELIKQLPEGSTPFATMLRKLGLWTSVAHNTVDERRPFQKNLASIGPDSLADEHAYWTSEAGRVSELHGFLMAQKVRTDLEVRIATSKARAQVRQNHVGKVDASGKAVKLTTTEVNDLAEAQQVLADARENAVLVESTLAAVAATKEATLLYLNTLSREITRRGDLMKARL